MNQAPEADFDRLAAALARLLSEWWLRQADLDGGVARGEAEGPRPATKSTDRLTAQDLR